MAVNCLLISQRRSNFDPLTPWLKERNENYGYKNIIVVFGYFLPNISLKLMENILNVVFHIRFQSGIRLCPSSVD